MVAVHLSRFDILRLLSTIPDPEIPVVSIEEMGMLRDVVIDDGRVEVIITPTYTGCPAMGLIEADILATLHKSGLKDVHVRNVIEPAWTTDLMSEKAKEKLKAYGIAPPLHSSCNHDVFQHNEIACPRCNSKDTVMISRFGSTACKALYQCNDCKEPFDYFKCH